MKNRDEMVNSLFERRECYNAEQKKKRTMLARTAASLCCVCLVTLLGFGIWHSGVFSNTPPDKTAADAIYPGVKDTFDVSKGESPNEPAANDRIVINYVGNISVDRKMNICLFADDFVEMTQDEMISYYGVNYIPEVPSDIKAREENRRSGIYKSGGGTGEVYWDTDILNYSNEDFTRNVNLEVDKGTEVLRDYFYYDGTEKKSVINNIEVFIGLTDNGCYYAEFMYKGVGFFLNTNGLTQDEFVAVLASIIKTNP